MIYVIESGGGGGGGGGVGGGGALFTCATPAEGCLS